MGTQTTPNLGYDQEWTRRMELEKAVLVHLTESGSVRKWGAIYSHFYQDYREEIGEVLSQLSHRQHILVNSDGTARITVLGLRELQRCL